MLLTVERALTRDLRHHIDARRDVELPARGSVNQIVEVQNAGRFRPQEGAC